MKRLTIYRDGVLEINCENCPETKICKRAELTESDCLYFLTERLAEYEDAEEQGLLVWLPCKVGDSYFIIRKYCDEHGELPYATEHWGSDCLGCSKACNGELRIKEGRFNDVAQIVTFAKSIGKTIFLTEEEAEKALEEI